MKTDEQKCTGLKFRGRVSNYFNEKKCSFEHKESLTLLKRESCKCQECLAIIQDLINGDGGQNQMDCIDWKRFLEPVEIEDGRTYVMSASWESDTDDGGYVSELYFSEAKQ